VALDLDIIVEQALEADLPDGLTLEFAREAAQIMADGGQFDGLEAGEAAYRLASYLSGS